MRVWTRFRLVALAAVALAAPLGAQGGPPPEVRATVDAVEKMLGATDEASIKALIDARFTSSYKSAATMEAHVARLKKIRDALGGGMGGLGVERDDEGLLVEVLGAKGPILVRLVLDAKGLITKMELAPKAPPAGTPGGGGGPTGGPSWDNVTWESLPQLFRAAADGGFSGTLLARRPGEPPLRLAVGYADREARRPMALNTVFCIGSTPIDFTITGIMLLGQRGKLSLDDPITKYFPDVPADKRTITVRHLLTAKSGLPDFFDEGKYWDADLAWIDRDAAVARIFAQPLLFVPGTGSRHSHAAFGLLAALIERVTGATYPDFVRQEILRPLGMTRTGFYGESLGLSVADFAIGYGVKDVGLPNIPTNWGPTSWLIMGSGGMVSTLEDMDRYYTAIAEGRLLTGSWATWQQGASVGVGGSERGFFIQHATDGKGTSVLYLMNGEGRSKANREISGALARLAGGRR